MSVYATRGVIIRLLFLAIAVLCALVTACGRLRRRRVITLCYHGVTSAQESAFSRQMARVATRAVDVADIPHASTRRFEPPIVCVTFDDAFANLLDHALPITRAFAIPVMVFVPTRSLGAPPSWDIAPDHADAHQPTMTADQITHAAATGLCRFGSHSVTHRPLTELSPDEARRELIESKARLEALIGHCVDDFAFPHGACNERLIRAARAADYRRVFTLEAGGLDGCDDLWIRARMKMSPDVWPIEFILTISGAYDWLPRARRLRRAIARPAGAFITPTAARAPETPIRGEPHDAPNLQAH
jgi:peptidoglycan/xylan/chitin deacetylase (PgdA/CDA1 family)